MLASLTLLKTRYIIYPIKTNTANKKIISICPIKVLIILRIRSSVTFSVSVFIACGETTGNT